MNFVSTNADNAIRAILDYLKKSPDVYSSEEYCDEIENPPNKKSARWAIVLVLSIKEYQPTFYAITAVPLADGGFSIEIVSQNKNSIICYFPNEGDNYMEIIKDKISTLTNFTNKLSEIVDNTKIQWQLIQK